MCETFQELDQEKWSGQKEPETSDLPMKVSCETSLSPPVKVFLLTVPTGFVRK